MEEFRLPAVEDEDDRDSKLPCPHFASSPLRFRSSPSAHKSPAVNFRRIHQRSRSFSSLEDLKTHDPKIQLTEVEDEERMDMLWEDLNEEPGDITGDEGMMSSEFFVGSNRVESKWHGARELFCAKAVHHHRPTLVRILKVLKKLLFIKKSREKRPSQTDI
ncbi:hypothetical protein KSP39_PZI020178 [Platanthera zijinensis]|uniref:Uncharacterized protein n=1 Tax=Platanthera zijinensis TaxID=2320716 RepID=A0AAP0B1D8_9ASPA